MDIKVVGSQNEIYHKQKLLGEGAFGKAYLVKRKADNQLLVIKQMNIDHMSQQQKKQTIKQAQILRNLNHPNIVKFVQVYLTKQNKLKIVMQYAECGDLSKSISDHKKSKQHYDQNWILDWFTQICLAIKHVHDRKILHRDIKGQNIFITKANTLKLGDFGIARVLNKTMDKARTVVGTPYYLSPQIIQNKPYSFKSDIWSIGVVLYELCALTHPFTATSLQFLALKIVKGSYAAIPSHYSKDLKNLVSSMLSLDPNKRPSINDIFKNPLIQGRIKDFLTQTKRDHQFSHTILHNHKVEMFTNRLVQMKQQKDFQKERQKLKQEQEFIRQKLQRKRSQQKLKMVQNKQKDAQKQKQRQRQRQRLRSVQKQRQKQDIKRRQLQIQRERQRKQYQKKQSILQQQKRKQQQQRKVQSQYEQKQKAIRYQQQRRCQQLQLQRLRKQHYQIQCRQNQRQDQIRRNQKNRKNYQKEIQDQRKRKDLQEFARKQFFQNQEIMRRAKERANHDQYSQRAYQAPKISYQPKVQAKNNNFYEPRKQSQYESRKSAQNFHYQNKKKQKAYEPTQQEIQNAYVNPNFGKKNSISTNAVKGKATDRNSAQKRPSQQEFPNSARQEQEKKYLSVRDQMKKDRQNFMKNKDIKQQNPVEINQAKANVKTIKGAKWQRPSSRGKQTQQTEPQSIDSGRKRDFSQPSTNPHSSNDLGERTIDIIGQVVSPKDQQQFDRYINQLEGILQNVNKNIQQVQNKQQKSPVKVDMGQGKQVSPQKFNRQSKVNSMLSQMPEDEEILYRQDDHDTLKFSFTAEFKDGIVKTETKLPQIQASTDLDYFSNFSKLQALKMSLEDKFGTDNFVQLYRYFEGEMSDKGLDGFSNVTEMVDQAVKRFKIQRNLVLDSFTLLLTLIHMEEKMMSNN